MVFFFENVGSGEDPGCFERVLWRNWPLLVIGEHAGAGLTSEVLAMTT